MTWAPGQGTPIHDHCGLWCVEGVWQGQLEITRYELEEEDGDRARFSKHETLMAGTGSAGSLLPPHEYHTIRNPQPDRVSISLHVYQRAMGTCSTFEPDRRRLVPARQQEPVPRPGRLRRLKLPQAPRVTLIHSYNPWTRAGVAEW